MGKRLTDINTQINSSERDFKVHLRSSLPNDVSIFLDTLSQNYQVYIFSGVIRNYFLKINSIRDVDIFLDGSIDLEPLLSNFKYRRNSYGGYKITVADTIIDLWFLKDTWALNNTQYCIDFETAKYIPKTSFFNFSSIIYHYNTCEFHYTQEFVRFLYYKQIDMVFARNANDALCIVNSFYYSDKLHLKLGEKLKWYIKKIYKLNLEKFEDAQLKHFGNIYYTKDEIIQRIETLH